MRKKKRGYRANERRGLGAMEPERTSGTGTAASLPEWGSRNKAEAVKLKQMGVKAGIPDLCLPVPMGMYNGLYIEMKYDTGRLEDSQKKMLKALAAAGHYCTVCYGAEEAIRVLQEYINLKKIDAGKREDTMSEQNLMIRKNGKVKCIIFKE